MDHDLDGIRHNDRPAGADSERTSPGQSSFKLPWSR